MTYYIQTGVISILILALVFFNLKRRPAKFILHDRLFRLLVAVTAITVVLDVSMYLVDGLSGADWLVMNKVITLLYYICNPLVSYIWSIYAYVLVNHGSRPLHRAALFLAIPVAVVAVLSFLSLNRDILFYIDAANRYHRGRYFLVMAALSYIYLVITLIFIIRYRRYLHSRELMPLIFFIVPPTIGGIIQTLFFGTSVLWMCVSFSILVIFTNLQNITLSTDHLTGLFNRRQLDAFLSHINLSPQQDRQIAGMMIDLNKMKMINDRFGHLAGDQALEQSAAILRRSFRKDDFIARYGGDEFAVIITVSGAGDLTRAVERLEKNLAVFNTSGTSPFELSFSIGYDLFDAERDQNADGFIKHLDSLMYSAKKSITQNQ